LGGGGSGGLSRTGMAASLAEVRREEAGWFLERAVLGFAIALVPDARNTNFAIRTVGFMNRIESRFIGFSKLATQPRPYPEHP
jgi:hypothetical protein